MKPNPARSVLLFLVALSVAVLAAVVGAPAPRLRIIPDRNRVDRHSRNLPTEWDVEKGTNVRWSAEVGSRAYGGPVVAGGKVFVGTNNDNPRDPAVKGDRGVLMCFDEKTGNFLWQIVHDKLATGRVNDWPKEGIASSPAVDGDQLYYVSNRCEVVCAAVDGDPKAPGKGKVLWLFDMIGKLGVFPHNLAICSPLVVGDTVFVVTANGVDEGHVNIPAPEAPSFLALDKATGAVRWKSNLPTQALVEAKQKGGDVDIRALVNQGKLLMHGQWSNPVYAEPKGKPMVIFPGGDGWLYAFNPKNGDLLWKFDCNPKDAFYKLGPEATRNDFIATPVIWEDRLYIAVGQDPEHKTGVGHLWCVDITKTPMNADKDVSPDHKESALVWHFGGLVPPGAPGKRPYYFGRSLSTCAVHDGLCYAADLNGYLVCLDARTGGIHWEHSTKSQVWSSPLWADGKVYLGNDDGTMFVFRHGKRKELLAENEMEGAIRMWQTTANDTLFVITENATRLYAIGRK